MGLAEGTRKEIRNYIVPGPTRITDRGPFVVIGFCAACEERYVRQKYLILARLEQQNVPIDDFGQTICKDRATGTGADYHKIVLQKDFTLIVEKSIRRWWITRVKIVDLLHYTEGYASHRGNKKNKGINHLHCFVVTKSRFKRLTMSKYKNQTTRRDFENSD